MSQGILPLHYEVDPKSGGVTTLTGLPLLVEFCRLLGLPRLMSKVQARHSDQGRTDAQMLISLVLLNMAGG